MLGRIEAEGVEDPRPEKAGHGHAGHVVEGRKETETQRVSDEQSDRQAEDVDRHEEGAHEPIAPKGARSDRESGGPVDHLPVDAVEDAGEIDRTPVLDLGDDDDVVPVAPREPGWCIA